MTEKDEAPGVALLQGPRAFNKEAAPAFLDHACMLAGFAPPPGSPVGEGQGAGFAWCELHCGGATTAALLAASNPLGDFHGIDAREGLIEEGRALVAEGGVRNLSLHRAGLAEALELSLPLFDYVVVSGVYSWVPARERALVLAFVRKFLKPGGVAYLTYNARPGWNRLEPFRQIYREGSRGAPASQKQRLARARQIYAAMEKARAPSVLAGIPSAQLGQLEDLPEDVLAADYGNDFAQPLYVNEVAADFAAIDCVLAGPAEMARSLSVLSTHEPFKSLLASVPTPLGRELAKDMLLDTNFRRDVFVRGGRRLFADNRDMLMSGLAFALERPLAELRYEAPMPFGELHFDTPQARAIAETVDEAPRSMNELFAPARGDPDQAQAIGAALHALLSSAQVRPVYRRTIEAVQSAARMQSAIRARAASSSAIAFLPSGFGTAFHVPVADQIFAAEPEDAPADALAAAAVARLGGYSLASVSRGAILRRARAFGRTRAHYRRLGLLP
jgi:SAM-dependent methyltransferase